MNQQELGIETKTTNNNVGEYKFEPIKGYPMLNWKGKRPFNSTQFYPAQLKEVYGEDVDGWKDKIYWGDNLQVMSHLLKEYRGKVKLIYIDPPFDSKANYKKNIQLRNNQITNDVNVFEEKQYGDLWNNDEYLQFMYERLILLKELLHEEGTIFVHCDWHRGHHIRCLLDEVFSQNNMINEIIWRRKGGTALGSMNRLSSASDTILWYSKSSNYTINAIYADASSEYIEQQFRHSDPDGRKYMITVMRSPSVRPNLMYEYKGYKMPPNGWAVPLETMKLLDDQNRLHFPDSKDKQIYKKIYLDEYKGQQINNLWTDISTLKGTNAEILNYPTQKPEELLERILLLASNSGDIVLDSFMGSGTTMSASVKLGRKFIGADINLGAIQTSTKRILQLIDTQNSNNSLNIVTKLKGFMLYMVNNYDLFRNPLEAKDLLLDALEIQKLEMSSVYDGEKNGRMVKIMPVNRIATRADLTELIAGFDYKAFERRQAEKPNQPVEKIMIVCMGHEPDLQAHLQKEVPFKLDVEIVDILRDKSNLEFKRESEAQVTIKGGMLQIEKFYPMNLLQKLSMQKESVSDWKELVESVMVDWNYDGAILQPSVVDIPSKNEFVNGSYKVPAEAGTIRVKITDLLSESLEVELSNG